VGRGGWEHWRCQGGVGQGAMFCSHVLALSLAILCPRPLSPPAAPPMYGLGYGSLPAPAFSSPLAAAPRPPAPLPPPFCGYDYRVRMRTCPPHEHSEFVLSLSPACLVAAAAVGYVRGACLRHPTEGRCGASNPYPTCHPPTPAPPLPPQASPAGLTIPYSVRPAIAPPNPYGAGLAPQRYVPPRPRLLL